jgi:hypothetical protein
VPHGGCAVRAAGRHGKAAAAAFFSYGAVSGCGTRERRENPGRAACPLGVIAKRFEGDAMEDVLKRSVSMLEAVQGIERRLAGAGFEGVAAIAKLFDQLHAALDAVSMEEIDATMADIDRTRRALDTVGRDLGRLRRLKQTLGDGNQGH